MSRIIPIPTTRVGDLFVRQRLTQQAQLDQLAMFELQNQVSTGRRLQLPSDDAPSALRAINLQRLLDRKGQIRTNLQGSTLYLSDTESRLGDVSDMLISLRGEALGVAGTLATDAERRTVVQSIDEALGELVNLANSKSLGRYLFAGSRSQDQPYRFNGQYVEFLGNEGTLRSYVDLERLFETNLSGSEVFGGISTAVQGSVDLDPHTSAETLVSTINGGAGIGSNPAITISINTGLATESAVVDLSGAVTLGDVARLIEAGAPAEVTVNVTGTGLVLTSDDGFPVSVAEVAQGRTARELGILSDPDVPATDTITGDDLNPAVLKTTRLNDLLGTQAQGGVDPTGANNAIRLTAALNGDDFNDVTVIFEDLAVAGAEVANYDSGTNTLRVQIESGASTAAQVAAAINTEGTFTAAADYHDATSSTQIGSGAIDLGGAPDMSFANVTSGGSGEILDTASGLILTNGGESVTLDISDAQTVEDLLNLINGAGLGLLAEINADRDGINVRSRLSGADLTIGENGGTTATQLGIRTYTGETKLEALNRGLGVPTTADLEELDTSKLDTLDITARNGTNFVVDVSSAASLQEIVDLINGAPANTPPTAVLARLTANGNGIELIDLSGGPFTNDLQVADTSAAEYLGLQDSPVVNEDGDQLIAGDNVLGHDLMIEARDGTQLWIDLADAVTIQDVMDRINDAANAAGVNLAAQLAAIGNGLELVDTSVGPGSLSVHALEGSQAAHYLGFVPAGETEISSSTGALQSEDRNTIETDSVFNTLMRLRTALEDGDVVAIGREIDRLDEDLSRVNLARGEIGARLQNLNIIDLRLQDENVQLRAALSEEVDVDLVEAISSLTARQYAFEASLRTAGSLLQLSLLNFI
jgi:flagellin-like hook-associated protein FlgL